MRFFALLFACTHIAALDLAIPVVDMQDYYNEEKKEAFLDTLYDAMQTVGFFAVRNTGIDADIISSAYDQSYTFFKQGSDYKMRSFATHLNGQRGFVPSESAKGCKRKDKKEFYHITSAENPCPNIWPDQSGFEEAFTTLFKELEQYTVPLQRAIVSTINKHSTTSLDLDYLNRMVKGGDSLLRALYYPAMTQEEIHGDQGELFWAAPHTDIDLLTILPYATAKGLQVEIDGKWLNVVVPEDAFVVNIGDMLENMTNGLFVSSHHRVVAESPDQDRFSVVFFVHPYDQAPLNPLPAAIELSGGVQKYAEGTRQEFLWERLLELGIAPTLLEPYSKTGHTERQMIYGRQSPQVVDLLINSGLASPTVRSFTDE
ncbi:MAG: hypothetical protein RLZZ453_812 [Chlamydiota bacterium]|jgi:isopenicillin N synthase-like dioxygenase